MNNEEQIAAVLKQLRRKAHALTYDGERMNFPHGKQRGEEMLALLEILERAIGTERKSHAKFKSIDQDGYSI